MEVKTRVRLDEYSNFTEYIRDARRNIHNL